MGPCLIKSSLQQMVRIMRERPLNWQQTSPCDTTRSSASCMWSLGPKFPQRFWNTSGLRELPILDERGYLQECLRSDWPMFNRFGQAYITIAFPNIVKAWHKHKIQTDNMVSIVGNAKRSYHLRIIFDNI